MQRIEIWKTGRAWYWHIRASNGRTVSTGGEAFASKSNAMRAAKKVVATVLNPVMPQWEPPRAGKDGKIIIEWAAC